MGPRSIERGKTAIAGRLTYTESRGFNEAAFNRTRKV